MWLFHENDSFQLQSRFYTRKAALEAGTFSILDIDFAEKFTDILNIFFPSKITKDKLHLCRSEFEHTVTELRTVEEGYNWLVKNGGATPRATDELLQQDNMTLHKATGELEDIIKLSKLPKDLLLHIGKMASTILYKEIVMCVKSSSFEKIKVFS